MVYQVRVLCVILNVDLILTRKETTITHGKVQCYHFTGSGKGESKLQLTGPESCLGLRVRSKSSDNWVTLTSVTSVAEC